MNIKSNLNLFGTATLAVIVTLTSFQSVAQLSCKNVIAKPSVYRESFLPLKTMNNRVADFVNKLKEKPQELTSIDLTKELLIVQQLSEDYFASAGLNFQKLQSSVKIKNLKDTPEFNFSYNLYHLTGSATGDETSRLINGIHSNPRFQNKKLTVSFDLFFEFNFPDTAGVFIVKDMTLTIAPFIPAWDAAGLSSTLRHEIRHYIEQIKLVSGEMTLARAEYMEMFPADKSAYGNYLRLDELETHIRDVRLSLNSKYWEAQDHKLAKVMDNEKLGNMKVARKFMAKITIERLEDLITKSLAVLKNLKNEMPMSTSIDKQTGHVKVAYLLPPPYTNAHFNLAGILKGSDRKDWPNVDVTMKEIFDWQKKRTEEISAELKELKKKAGL